MKPGVAPAPAESPLYVVRDWRTDGQQRALATFREPGQALAYADALRAAGDPVTVDLLARNAEAIA